MKHALPQVWLVSFWQWNHFFGKWYFFHNKQTSFPQPYSHAHMYTHFTSNRHLPVVPQSSSLHWDTQKRWTNSDSANTHHWPQIARKQLKINIPQFNDGRRTKEGWPLKYLGWTRVHAVEHLSQLQGLHNKLLHTTLKVHELSVDANITTNTAEDEAQLLTELYASRKVIYLRPGVAFHIKGEQSKGECMCWSTQCWPSEYEDLFLICMWETETCLLHL